MSELTLTEKISAVRIQTIRRKLLRLLPRNALERVSGLEDPWHADRANLDKYALDNWDEDTFDIILKYVNKAK